jgi:Tfp pilus assembly pilus retraction ATPase PilT
MGILSILDLLTYFQQRGAMRVSDLHIKVGTPPAYRIDGDITYLKGEFVTPDIARKLILPLMSEENLRKFQAENNADKL